MTRFRTILAVFCLGIWANPAPAQETEPAEAVGVIHTIDTDGRIVSLTHDPIPAIGWPAMTMDLGIAPDADLTGIKPDMVVLFTLDRGPDGMYRIATIAPAPEGTAVAAAEGEAMDHGTMDHSAHAGHAMTLDAAGMVMNVNTDTVPEDCAAISGDHAFTVRVGRQYAEPFADMIFGYSQYEFAVEPCSRVTVTLINEDAVRHQWMLHGLPHYLYPQGMFHIETAGGATKTGTFIVPGDQRTYLVHCDMTQHMEKGLKAQLMVGGGDGTLPSIPGISGPMVRGGADVADVWWHGLVTALIGVVGCAIGVVAFRTLL
jgi:Cu/Ag efflux protein CusF